MRHALSALAARVDTGGIVRGITGSMLRRALAYSVVFRIHARLMPH
jgi:hypothetical protein